MNEILKNNKKLNKVIRQVAEVANYLWQNGWAERNAGNISVNVDEYLEDNIFDPDEYPRFELEASCPELANRYFFVTGTGKRMRDLARNPQKNAVLIRITGDGKAYHMFSRHKHEVDQFRPTSELPTHLGIHQLIAQRGSHEKVVIHTHANELVALTHSPDYKSTEKINKVIWGMHPESMVFIPKGVGFVPYILPGTQEIAKETIMKLKDHDIILWEKHGIFAIGPSVFDTFDSIDIVCKSAKIWFLCKSAGFDPEGLSDMQLSELKELVKKFQAK